MCRLQSENQALQNLLKQQGSGGERSAERLARLKQRYTQLTQKVACNFYGSHLLPIPI